jgi:phosphatidylglycerol---prolipoprotein diacylglyceryl transferase
MIPFIHVPDLPISSRLPITLHPFGLLVATGVIIGTWLATKRARERGLDLDKLNSFITWMLVAGFVGGHVFDQILYHPKKLLTDPLLIVKIWEGLSSFGGFTGGLIGVLLWKYFEAVPLVSTPFFTIPKFRRRSAPLPILPFADLILSVFPVAWIFGRSGCASVHDHLGADATPGTPLTVAAGQAAGGGPIDWGKTVFEATFYQSAEAANRFTGKLALTVGPHPRFDLGLLEMLFTVVLAVLFALTWGRKLTTGSYLAATALAYAPVRLAMDFLRLDSGLDDPRYAGFTPAQWACVALFVFGIVMVLRVRQIRRSGRDPIELVSLPAVSSPPVLPQS